MTMERGTIKQRYGGLWWPRDLKGNQKTVEASALHRPRSNFFDRHICLAEKTPT